MTEPTVPEALQRAVDDAVEAWYAGYEMCPHTISALRLECSVCLRDTFIRHVLAAKVCTEPEHKLPAAFVNSLRERAEAAEQALAAAQAEHAAALERAKAAEQALATIGTEAGLAGLVSARGWPLPEQLLAAEQRAEEAANWEAVHGAAVSKLTRERDEATAKLEKARVMLRRMTQIVVNEFSVDPGHVESHRNVKAYQEDVDAALAALDAPAKQGDEQPK